MTRTITFKGYTSSVWDRLVDHNPPLVDRPNFYRPTACGMLFYLRNYQRYQEVYPDIDTPIPSETEAEIISELKSPEGNKSALARIKRWNRGMKETAAEIGNLNPFALRRFEKGQSVDPGDREQILSWLRH